MITPQMEIRNPKFEIRNSKSEYRNPKQIQISKFIIKNLLFRKWVF